MHLPLRLQLQVRWAELYAPSRIPFQDICLVMGGWETLVVTSKKPGYCWNKRCFYMSILTCLSLLSPLYCHGSEGEAPSLSS